MEKKFRIQLTERELRRLRNLLANQYYFDKRNLRYEKKLIAKGKADSQVYPIALQEKHLKEIVHLLKKLSRKLNIKWFER